MTAASGRVPNKGRINPPMIPGSKTSNNFSLPIAMAAKDGVASFGFSVLVSK